MLVFLIVIWAPGKRGGELMLLGTDVAGTAGAAALVAASVSICRLELGGP